MFDARLKSNANFRLDFNLKFDTSPRLKASPRFDVSLKLDASPCLNLKWFPWEADWVRLVDRSVRVKFKPIVLVKALNKLNKLAKSAAMTEGKLPCAHECSNENSNTGAINRISFRLKLSLRQRGGRTYTQTKWRPSALTPQP